MANPSDARGTMCISKETIQNDVESVELLLSALCSMENRVEYGIFPEEVLDKLKSDLNEAKESKTDLILLFSGTGRWSFENTLNYFFESLTIFHLITNFTAFSKPNQKLTFDFVDYEASGHKFYKGIYEISLQLIENRWMTVSEKKWVQGLPFTAKNIMDYGICEEAYDANNLTLLLNNKPFIDELATSIPQKKLTLHFLQDFWEKHRMNATDDSAIYDFIEDMSNFYIESYKEPII
ncbi:hypothetical protein HCJ33_10280 [Listeria seeligeri]|uniref:hypothetical protein n=1 Tax=Listeria seeligeri TaxID=1640 RepID=UPI00162425E0|nr:hypothetical protein [Listeria seeligeri]MBC1990354.1 hypothetical protein [Listeria seeligeri]